MPCGTISKITAWTQLCPTTMTDIPAESKYETEGKVASDTESNLDRYDLRY